MSNRNAQDPLDRLLCQWADEQSPTAADVARLTDRIVQAADGPMDPPDTLPKTVAASAWQRSAAVWLTLGTAAAIALALGYMWLGTGTTQDTPIVSRPAQAPPASAWLRDEQLRTKSLLLKEMESIYGRKLNWLAETEHDVQVEIERPLSTPENQVLAVRVVVERRPVGQPNWDVAWAIDVVARSEEVVRLAPAGSGAPQFEMWAFALPDGLIALDTDLRWDTPLAVRSATTEVHANREPHEIFTAEANGFEFRIFQTAALLNDRLS